MIIAAGAGTSGDPGDFFVPVALAERIKSIIARPKARDKQRMIGPSGIGDPCALCLAGKMAQMLPNAPRLIPQRFKFPSWIGTAVHSQMDTLMQEAGLEGWQGERKVTVGDVEGYGTITGSTDGYYEPAATVVDWKVVGKNTLNKLRLHGLSTVYEYQRQCYGLGIENEGLPIKFVMNFYIPREGDCGIKDVVLEVNHYDRSLAEEALDRAAYIWKNHVLTNKWMDLPSDEDCFECNRFDTYQHAGGPIVRAVK